MTPLAALALLALWCCVVLALLAIYPAKLTNVRNQPVIPVCGACDGYIEVNDRPHPGACSPPCGELLRRRAERTPARCAGPSCSYLVRPPLVHCPTHTTKAAA